MNIKIKMLSIYKRLFMFYKVIYKWDYDIIIIALLVINNNCIIQKLYCVKK